MTAIDYSRGAAVITGASSGLGAEFARQLAARGAGLVLVARRADRLDALATDLRAKYGVSVATFPLDLSQADAAAALRSETDRLGVEVHTLINNAGFGMYGPFATADAERITE